MTTTAKPAETKPSDPKTANTGAPATPGAPVAPTSPSQVPGGQNPTTSPSDPAQIPPAHLDPNANPALVERPSQARPLHAPDKDSNPAALGGGQPNPPAGVVQTTIDTETTTIHPEASILNPVDRNGESAEGEIKAAVVPTIAGASSSNSPAESIEEIQERFRVAAHTDAARKAERAERQAEARR